MTPCSSPIDSTTPNSGAPRRSQVESQAHRVAGHDPPEERGVAPLAEGAVDPSPRKGGDQHQGDRGQGDEKAVAAKEAGVGEDGGLGGVSGQGETSDAAPTK